METIRRERQRFSDPKALFMAFSALAAVRSLPLPALVGVAAVADAEAVALARGGRDVESGGPFERSAPSGTALTRLPSAPPLPSEAALEAELLDKVDELRALGARVPGAGSPGCPGWDCTCSRNSRLRLVVNRPEPGISIAASRSGSQFANDGAPNDGAPSGGAPYGSRSVPCIVGDQPSSRSGRRACSCGSWPGELSDAGEPLYGSASGATPRLSRRRPRGVDMMHAAVKPSTATPAAVASSTVCGTPSGACATSPALMVGCGVGAVGSAVGACVGCELGLDVGCSLGRVVGSRVGTVGAALGALLGCSVVGCEVVGCRVVGFAVLGAAVLGCGVGRGVGGGVGRALGAALGALGDGVCASASAQSASSNSSSRRAAATSRIARRATHGQRTATAHNNTLQ
jgi:hypothetical protein